MGFFIGLLAFSAELGIVSALGAKDQHEGPGSAPHQLDQGGKAAALSQFRSTSGLGVGVAGFWSKASSSRRCSIFPNQAELIQVSCHHAQQS